MNYRKLSAEEIRQLTEQGCDCKNWDLIEVIDNFTPQHLKNVYFDGVNRIGRFDEDITLFGGACLKTGIYNVQIKNCIVENNALIKNIPFTISNCRIGEKVVMHQVLQPEPENNENKPSYPLTWFMSAQ